MIVYPAVDILDGKAVRLEKGSFDKVTVFNDDPVEAAKNWASGGAEWVHIVDLDGARYGKSCIEDVLKKIASLGSFKVQTGGGVRSLSDIDMRINAGADRVVLGTVAVTNPALVAKACEKYGDKIAVGVDAKDGYVAVKGWEQVSDVSAIDLCKDMKAYGIKNVIYTDITRDGMMTGPNLTTTKTLIDETGLNVIASGGVSTLNDVKELKKIGASGVIIGVALYNGSIDLTEALNS